MEIQGFANETLLKNSVNEKSSYVDKLKLPGKGSSCKLVNKAISSTNININKPSQYAILITNKNDTNNETDLNTLMETITKSINPSEFGLNINCIRTTQQKDLCIELRNKKDTETLISAIESIQSLSDKINIRQTNKKNPRIILLNTPTYLNEKQIFKYIYNQNSEIKNTFETTDFAESCKIITKFRKKNGDESHRHVVVSVPPRVKNLLIKLQNISLDWAVVRVDDYIPLLRCYNCCGFNHLAKDCKAALSCSHYGDRHNYKNCPNTEKQPTCVN